MLYLQKHTDSNFIVKLNIIINSAKHGGGVYVADNSTAGSLQCQGMNGQENDE